MHLCVAFSFCQVRCSDNELVTHGNPHHGTPHHGDSHHGNPHPPVFSTVECEPSMAVPHRQLLLFVNALPFILRTSQPTALVCNDIKQQ